MESVLRMEDFKEHGIKTVNSSEELATCQPYTVIILIIKLIVPNPRQPRKTFLLNGIRRLKVDLEESGSVESPLHVTLRDGPKGKVAFLVDGERRLKAAKKAGFTHIHVLIKPQMTDKEVFLRSAKANIDVEPMLPVDEAMVVVRLINEYNMTKEQAARSLGRSNGHVENILKYLKLTPSLQKRLTFGSITRGIALAVSRFEKEKQEYLLSRLEEIEKKEDKKMHPHRANEILINIAEKEGIKLLKNSKGRKHLSSTDHLVNGTMRAIRKMKERLEQISAIEKNEFKGTKTHILDLLGEMQELQELLNVQVERIDKIAG